MGRIRRIVKGLLAALTTAILLAVPAWGEEILSDESITGGWIKAGAALITSIASSN